MLSLMSSRIVDPAPESARSQNIFTLARGSKVGAEFISMEDQRLLAPVSVAQMELIVRAPRGSEFLFVLG